MVSNLAMKFGLVTDFQKIVNFTFSKGVKTGDAHFSAEQAAKDYSVLRKLLDAKFGPRSKKLLTLSGNWELIFMDRFTKLFNNFDAVAWHWYPLGPGRLVLMT